MRASGLPLETEIRVLLCDDQELVRAGFRLILDLEDGIEVVGEAADGAACLREVARTKPDVVLLDIRMPNVDGVEATRRLVAAGSSARVLVLTTFDLDENVCDSMRAGASGLLLKDVPREQLVFAVRAIAHGDALLSTTVTPEAGREIHLLTSSRPCAQQIGSLSEREREVFGLLALGPSNAEIAATLFLSDSTLKTHVSNVLAKLGLRDRIQAIVLAYESGYITPGREVGGHEDPA